MTAIETSSSLLEAALGYARRGWPVFPCKPGNKMPLLARDRDAKGEPIRGSGGVTKASTDEDQIRAWWKRWPRAMIGVSVGRGGMLVIDFDPRVEEVTDLETGEVTRTEWTLEQLRSDLEAHMGCSLPISLAARTPSGGVHVYYRMPDGEPIGNRGNLPRHIDVRGEGGYVIAPPSYCDGEGKNTKGPYRWLRGDADADIVEPPAALVAILRAPAERSAAASGKAKPPRAPSPDAQQFTVDIDEAHRRYAMHALEGEVRELVATPRGGGRYGGRNQGAYSAAFNVGQLVGAGALSESMARAALVDAVGNFDPGYRDKHIEAVENGLANGMAKPRDLTGVSARSSAQGAHGRASGRSADPSEGTGPPPLPPVEAYDDDRSGPGPARAGESNAPFQSGTVAPAAVAGVGGRIAPVADPETDRKCARLPLTDLGNAERFRMRHGWRFRFCNEIGWFIWEGRRWEVLSEEKDKVPGKVSLAVFDTVRAIANEAGVVAASGLREELPEDATDAAKAATLDFIVKWRGSGDNKVPVYFSDEIRAHAKSSEGASRLGCIAALAKSFGDIAIAADAMDRDRMAINVLNGTLRIGMKGNRAVIRLDRHDPADLISKVANVVYDPNAKSPDYDGFLSKVQPDAATVRFLHQWGGLSLTGDIREQKLAFFHGKGRNGKSTLVDAWSHVAGDYGGSVGIETFLDQGRGRKGGDATPDLARLPGIRFLRTSEPEKGAKLAEALIKLITGGELIDARFLNKGFFSFLPSFKVTISGNHKPKITGHDDGIWRRVMLVPWDVQIDVDAVDKALPEKLQKEASGVLNRLLEGLLDWKENGLIEPASVLAATAKYREQSDQLGRFLMECTKHEPGGRSKSSLLFELFTAWAKSTGAAEWQPVGFSKAMEDRGFEKKASNGMQWLDVVMTRTADEFAEGASATGSRYEPPPPVPGDYDDMAL